MKARNRYTPYATKTLEICLGNEHPVSVHPYRPPPALIDVIPSATGYLVGELRCAVPAEHFFHMVAPGKAKYVVAIRGFDLQVPAPAG